MHTEIFEQNRSRLTGIAYGMLGSVMDAEDIVQDTYLRWRRVDVSTVDSPPAYLTTMITRTAIDRLHSAQARQETYVGPWLPEPLVGTVEPDPAAMVEAAESLSMALLSALERLKPVERAVLLLREIFDLDYSEIADIVDKSPANCRQIAKRARERAGDLSRPRASQDIETQIINRYIAAVMAGNLDRLAEIFADDVVLWSDGGGKARAARHPLFGANRVARHLLGTSHLIAEGTAFRVVRANGDIAIAGEVDGVANGLIIFEIADDRVNAIRAILNPDKLTRVSRDYSP